MIHVINRLIVFFVMLGLLNACRQPLKKVSFQGEAQGTYYAVTYYDTEGRNLSHQIDSLLKAFDMSMSLWVPESVISRINRGDSTVIADSMFQRVF
ncbi:MAG: FAD:protein FMN transferase, partial [Bacteroidetes bacterium HGW-Bacteroidetes-22]